MKDLQKFIKSFSESSQSERQEKLNKLDAKSISDTIIEKAENDFSLILFTAVLKISDEEKLLKIVNNVLSRLNRDALSLRQYQDFVSKFMLELPHKSLKFVLQVAEFCTECCKEGNQKIPFYKDVLPLCLKILQKANGKMLDTKDGEKTARDASVDIVNGILRNDFAISTLTTLVSMFKDIEVTSLQQELLITKVCSYIEKVDPQDIGNLALVTFQQASYNQIIMPLLALDKYFYKRRYKYEINEFDSAPDDIGETSSEGLVQAEETTIYHFQSIAEFTTMEKNLATALKALEFTPSFILSPFLATILVSIAKISSNVQGNFRLNQSTILPFMKQVFKFNEEHRQILKISGWAKSIDPVEAVNTDLLLKMLKENTCALKQDVALNGLFGLAFLLLKTKASPELNKFAIDFLNDIIKSRSEFTSDILHIVVKMLFSEKNKAPIIECFSSFVQNRHLNISASEPALQKLIEDLTELDLETALAIESVIFTAITKSINLRDLMIDLMKKAMYQRNVEIRKMAIFSFCIMLRKFTKPTRSSASTSSTQSRFSHNLSMFSLTQSQIAISASANRNIRQVEIIMLEILGLLRKCFSESIDIKVMLYESLLNSIQANSFIISNVLEFVDGHFRMYFDCEEEMLMDFDKLFKHNESNDELIIMDDLGQLLKFMISCIVMTKEHHQKLNYDINIYEKILQKITEKCISATMEQLHVLNAIDLRNSVITRQFLNCCEALMLYAYYQMKQDNVDYISKILLLFDKHQEVQRHRKKLLEGNKKSTKSESNKNTTTMTEFAKTQQQQQQQRKVDTNVKSIWNLKECAAFLKVIFADHHNERLNELRENKAFCEFVLATTSQRLAELETSAEHSKLKYSRSTFDAILACSTIFYQQLDTNNFVALHDNYSGECAASLSEAFKCLIRATETTYRGKREKFNLLLKAMTQRDLQHHDSNSSSTNNQDDYDLMLHEIIERIHSVIEWGFEQEKKSVDFLGTSTSAFSVVSNLIASLQILYGKFYSTTKSRECFSWILNFSKRTNVKNKTLAAVIIKLFIQCINQHENALLIEYVAHKIALCYHYRREMSEVESNCSPSQNNFAIITKQTVDDAFVEYVELIKHQVYVVEFYIKRSNSFNAHARLRGQEPSSQQHHDTRSTLQTLEMAICTKIISLGRAIQRIVSCKFPISTRNIERVVGVVKLFYACLVNLMKHFRKHHEIKRINYGCIGLEELIKFTKKLAACVYSIAPYIEKSNETEFSKGTKDCIKARVKKRDAIMNKETKTIPRMIFLIETFNTQVVSFDSAAKTSFSKHLHPGEVRDFHIGKKLLSRDDLSDEDEAEAESDDESSKNDSITQKSINANVSDNENVQPDGNKSRKSKRRLPSTSASSPSSSSEGEEQGGEEHEEISKTFEKEDDAPMKVTRGARGRAVRGRAKATVLKATSKNVRRKK